MAVSLDLQNFVLHRSHGHDVHLLDVPWQQLEPTIQQISARALVQAESETRTVMDGLQAVDTQVFQLATKDLDFHARNIITSVATLSSVDQSLLHRFDSQQTQLCIFCRAAPSSIDHI
eukprot:11996583-Karenia_brevis.AAC.1